MMEIISQLSDGQLERIMCDGLRWKNIPYDKRYKSFLYKMTSKIQELHTDKIVTTCDVVDMASVELLKRRSEYIQPSNTRSNL